MNLTTKQLKAKFPYIPAYSKIMGSYEYWTAEQLAEAEQINAPADTYRVNNGKYYTLSDIQNPQLLKELNELK